MKRFQDREANGRFRRNTTENLFGIRTLPCTACGTLNPYTRAEPVRINGFIDPMSMNRWNKPTRCSQCKKDLSS